MRHRLFTILFFMTLGLGLIAQDFPERPKNLETLHEYAEMFSESESLELAKIGKKIEAKQGIQTLIIVVESLDGLTPVDYIYGLCESWGLQRTKKILIVLLKPKTEISKGEVFFATSYGRLDRIIPDSKVQEIISETVIPNFKKNKMFKGTKKGLQRIIKTIKKNIAQQNL